MNISRKPFSKGVANRNEKGNSLLAFPESYTVIDLETTGLDPKRNDIIEFGAIKVKNGRSVDCFSYLVNPGYKIDDFITQKTGITNEMLSTASDIHLILPKFLDFIGDSIVIGHNVNFDINFIYDSCMKLLQKPFKNDFIDTLRMSRILYRQEKHHRFRDLAERFDVANSVKHRALSDAELTNSCYLHIKQYVEENNIDILQVLTKKKNAPKVSAIDIMPTTTEFDEASPCYKKLFVFTGTLERMTRNEAMQLVVNRGGVCGNGVNRKTNYLVIGNFDYCSTIKDGKSSKHKRAEQLYLDGYDIKIISEDVFYDMIDD